MNLEQLLPEPTTISRIGLFDAYVEMQVDHLQRRTGKSKEELIPKVQEIIQQRYKSKKITALTYPSYGNVKVVENVDLWGFLKKIQNTVISPNGTFFKTPQQCQSVISQMVIDKLAERKKVKKLQLKAAGAGDDVLANMYHFQQATIKILCNSLPGGFGSAFNIFYDKPAYNTITSTARCMIARAYTICEQLLGGNFAWFKEEELLNHILVNLQHRPDDEKIEWCMKRYKLKVPTKKMLGEFYEQTIRQYIPQPKLVEVYKLIDTLSQNEITFLFYYCNLRHIMWYNEEVFKPYIKHVMDVDDIAIDENVTKDDAFKIDETITTVTTVAFADKLESHGLVDICEDYPQFIPKLVAYSKAVEKRLHLLDPLFETFVCTTADIPEHHKKPMTWRNMTVVSDTDSILLTADAWDTWYRNGRTDLDQESYQIASLVIYWLHHTVEYVLRRFSINYGVTGPAVSRLAMKNEFLYDVMMIFDKKKTYVGIQKVQEGVIFKKPKVDIKGQTLRGSAICAPALKFSEEVMIKDILEPCTKGKISANEIIKKVCDFENAIAESIVKEKSMTYLKITSLKTANDYKTPDSASVIVAHRFWQEIFAKKYEDIHPPTKVNIFTVVPPTQDYWDWLEKFDPEIYRKMRGYFIRMKKLPNQMVINPICKTIPEEMVPLISVRDVIWHCIQPAYSTLSRINIAVGCEKQKLLLSDIYTY